jgi:hypothetical protein
MAKTKEFFLPTHRAKIIFYLQDVIRNHFIFKYLKYWGCLFHQNSMEKFHSLPVFPALILNEGILLNIQAVSLTLMLHDCVIRWLHCSHIEAVYRCLTRLFFIQLSQSLKNREKVVTYIGFIITRAIRLYILPG